MLGQRVCSPTVMENAFIWCNIEAQWVCIRVLLSDAIVVSYQSSCELEWRRILFPNVWHRLNSGLVIPASAAWQQQAAKYSKAVMPSVASAKACFFQRTSYIKEIKSNLAFSEGFYEKCGISWISWQKSITEYHSWRFSWLYIGKTCDLWGKAPEVFSACPPSPPLS